MRRKFVENENKLLNADEREILERLQNSQGNSAKFRVKDFTFGHDRFISALDSLFHANYIGSSSCLYNHVQIMSRFDFTFKSEVKDDDTEVELIKTDKGKRYLKENP